MHNVALPRSTWVITWPLVFAQICLKKQMSHERWVSYNQLYRNVFFGAFTHKMREMILSFITTARPSGILGSHWKNVPEILNRVFYWYTWYECNDMSVCWTHLVFFNIEKSDIINVTFRETCIVIYSYNKRQRDAQLSQIYMIKYSTCFGQVHCPSSGVFEHCIHAIDICNASSGSLREDCTHGRFQEFGVDISWTAYLWNFDSETVWKMCRHCLGRISTLATTY
jgi:hypothetical protein